MTAPDFVYQSGEPMTKDERHAWWRKCADEARAKGATFIQISIHDTMPDLTLLEGWKVRPDPFPPPHFQLTTALPTHHRGGAGR